jgi:hypothetical protein
MINIALGARIVITAHVASLPVYLSVTVLPLFILGGQWGTRLDGLRPAAVSGALH